MTQPEDHQSPHRGLDPGDLDARKAIDLFIDRVTSYVTEALIDAFSSSGDRYMSPPSLLAFLASDPASGIEEIEPGVYRAVMEPGVTKQWSISGP